MEASIQRIRVLALAEVTHMEVAHSSVFAVVGQLLDYRVAWSTVSAGDEKIVVSPVTVLSELCEAFWANGYVRWDD